MTGITRGKLGTLDADTSSSTSLVITWASNPTAGDKVLIALAVGAGTNKVTSVKDNGTVQSTFTADRSRIDATNGYSIYAYRADGVSLPSSGSYKVTVAMSPAEFATGAGYSYEGVATGAPTSGNDNASTTGSNSVSTNTATPANAGALFFAVALTDSSLSSETITLTGSGFTEQATETDGATSIPLAMADKIDSGGPTATQCTWTLGDTPVWDALIVTYDAATVTVSGAASLSGSGSMGAVPGPQATSGMSGSGIMAALPGPAASASLGGEGDMAATGSTGGAALYGSGSMTAGRGVTWQESASLYGSGTLLVTSYAASLYGAGTLGITGLKLGLSMGLSGSGSLSIPQVAGGLVNGVGGAATPYALPGSSQVAVAPPGSSNWQWLGTLGQVTALTYSFNCPGGCDSMTCTLMVPASYRTQMFNPGWQVKIVRGGHQVWYGKLDEPQPSPSGWTLTAEGAGNFGQDFVAYYTSTWPASQPDQSINDAISRGMNWANPGVGTPSGAWYGQAVDPGAQTVTALLNLICTRGGLTWYVNSQPGGLPGNDLSVFPLPTTPNRLLVCTTPVARTLGGYTNTIWIRYEVTADDSTTGASATYATVSAQNAASVAAHGVLETYLDLSDAGVLTAGQAQGVGQKILSVYEAASWAGPFTASYGQLLNMGGQAIDPGTDQAGTRVRLILTDAGYGGEVIPGEVTFTVGSYSWDDYQMVATIGPYQELDQSLSGLMQATSTVMTPITTASA